MTASTTPLQIDPGDAVAEALFGKTRRALLGVLFGQPDERFYLTQLMDLCRSGRGSVQREIERLSSAGIVTRERRGNQVLYQANRRSPVFPELLGLARKSMGVADALRQALVPLSQGVESAFVYGSFARGEQRSDSDIDVMLVGDVSFAEVVAALRPLQQTLGREINPSIFSRQEFRKKLREKNHFLTRVMSSPKTFLIGGDHELKAMAGARMVGQARDQRPGVDGLVRRRGA